MIPIDLLCQVQFVLFLKTGTFDHGRLVDTALSGRARNWSKSVLKNSMNTIIKTFQATEKNKSSYNLIKSNFLYIFP